MGTTPTNAQTTKGRTQVLRLRSIYFPFWAPLPSQCVAGKGGGKGEKGGFDSKRHRGGKGGASFPTPSSEQAAALQAAFEKQQWTHV